MIQTQSIAQRLRQQWPNLDIHIEPIHTTGDRVTTLPLSQIGGDGVFVTEIEHALHERRIDLAVHSLKDLPTIQPAGLTVVVTGPREDVRDALILASKFPIAGDYSPANSSAEPRMKSQRGDGSPGHHEGVGRGPGATGRGQAVAPTIHDGRSGEVRDEGTGETAFMFIPGGVRMGMNDLPANPRIGTCSLRRTAQILALYPDAQILPLRGNVDTRLRKLDAGDYDAIILASAGLHRLNLQEGLADRLYRFPVDIMMPAPGQGALALECRNEPEILSLLAPLQDLSVQAATTAERAFMRALGAGCYLPVAAYGAVSNDRLDLRGLVINLDGQQRIPVQHNIPWSSTSTLADAEQLGVTLAQQALAQGAASIIRSLTRVHEQEHIHV